MCLLKDVIAKTGVQRILQMGSMRDGIGLGAEVEKMALMTLIGNELWPGSHKWSALCRATLAPKNTFDLRARVFHGSLDGQGQS